MGMKSLQDFGTVPFAEKLHICNTPVIHQQTDEISPHFKQKLKIRYWILFYWKGKLNFTQNKTKHWSHNCTSELLFILSVDTDFLRSPCTTLP